MPEKLYRVDTENWQIVEVECPNGTEYPESDGDGFMIYVNTHFHKRECAMSRLRDEAFAGVRLAGAAVEHARHKLREAEKKAAEAAVAFAKVCDAMGLPF